MSADESAREARVSTIVVEPEEKGIDRKLYYRPRTSRY
jgi:hypothetical protein